MADIFDCVKVSDNIRPRYTPYEIIYMIKEKQKQSGLSLEEFCAKYNLTLEGYEKLISYKGVFNLVVLLLSEMLLLTCTKKCRMKFLMIQKR